MVAMSARVFRQCACSIVETDDGGRRVRDSVGRVRRQLGALCPRLAEDDHGRWAYQADLPRTDEGCGGGSCIAEGWNGSGTPATPPPPTSTRPCCPVWIAMRRGGRRARTPLRGVKEAWNHTGTTYSTG